MDEPYFPLKTICDSGLTVITMKVPGCEGLISAETLINLGAAHAHEIHPRLTGIPHFLEHMILFGASRNFGPREVAAWLPQEFALRHNASTNHTMTRFFQSGGAHVLPAELFWDAFAAVMDGTFFPKIDQETFDIEYKRIINEIKTVLTPERMDIDNVIARMNSLPYYGRVITGSVEDVKTFTRDECIDFHQNYYTLSNTIIVLTGDVQHEREVAKLDRLLAEAARHGPAIPAIAQRQFRSEEFRKPSDKKESEGTSRVEVIWAGNNYSKPKQAYAQRLAIRQLNQFISTKLLTNYGLYHAQIAGDMYRGSIPIVDFKVEGGDKQAVHDALQYGLEKLKSPDTLDFLSEQHSSTVRQEEISERTAPLDLQDKTKRLMDLHTIEAPLDLFGSREIERIRDVRPEDVQAVITDLIESPLFLVVRGHEAALDAIPEVDEVSGWLSSPNAPSPISPTHHTTKNYG